MIIPDVNLLLYAYDTESPFQQRAAQWWSHCLSGRQTVGLCDVVLCAFIRIGTSRRAFRTPLSIAKASEHIRTWMERSVTEFLTLQKEDFDQMMQWLEGQDCGGNLTTDAQIAAIAHRHQATIHSADSDFERFPGVLWQNPLRKK